MNPQATNREEDIKYLNTFLKHERAAVETYTQCIEKMKDEEITAALLDLQRSHLQRVGMLNDKVEELGGTPEQHRGTWGSFAKVVEGGAKTFGEKSALSALEEGEDRGVRDYQEKAEKLSPDCQSFIETVIRPEQQRTHRSLNEIIESISQ